jgi:hypothetical protein
MPDDCSTDDQNVNNRPLALPLLVGLSLPTSEARISLNPKGIPQQSPATVLNWQLFFQSFFGAFGAGWASSALS